MKKIQGKVWKFGNNINTDAIAPGRYMNSPVSELRDHALEVVNPAFAKEVKQGDIIVGGNNFGCGSSREEATTVLQESGIAAILGESFARIFFRNAIARGLPIMTCSGISEVFHNGQTLELDIDNATVTNLDTGKVLSCEPLSDEIMEVLEKGGIMPLLKAIAAEQNKYE